jgi:hypothetical protein
LQARLIRFGLLEVEGQRYEYDVVIEAGVVRKRSKKASKPYRQRFGHTPLSVDEEIPWRGPRLVIGTGDSGRLPVMDEIFAEADRRGIELVAVPTREACALLADVPAVEVSAILHVTC